MKRNPVVYWTLAGHEHTEYVLAIQHDEVAAVVARQRAEIRRLKTERKELLSLVALLPQGYPDGEWEGLLHEEGCNGVRHRRYSDGTRDDENACKCDGDYNSDRIKAALKPTKETR